MSNGFSGFWVASTGTGRELHNVRRNLLRDAIAEGVKLYDHMVKDSKDGTRKKVTIKYLGSWSSHIVIGPNTVDMFRVPLKDAV